MASLREIAREYKDEIMSGIAWVAIWKTGRSWNARAFWLNSDTELRKEYTVAMVQRTDTENVSEVIRY